jgi:transposase
MAKPLVSDQLWEAIRPLLPPPKPRRFRYPGRKPVDDRRALTGILFVLQTVIPWEGLPGEMGGGCGMTCWRRLHARQEAGVWFRLHQVLLQRLDDADQLDWSRAAVDATFARACGGVEGTPLPEQTHKLAQHRQGGEVAVRPLRCSVSRFSWPAV